MKGSIYKQPGCYLIDHTFEVPIDYEKPDAGNIEIYGREVVSLDNARRNGVPWLVYFQGGPGSPSPRPVGYSGWLKRALREFRVLLLDQRGTGRSSAVNYQSLEKFDTAEEVADYLKNFRADNIVRDAEFIREQLAGEKTQWYGLGQSFGGFILTSYLSMHPEGLAGVLITGGIPPVGVPVDDVYRATYKRCKKRNERYYDRYRDDVKQVGRIVDYLTENKALLPGGGQLTVERFQQLGIAFGMANGYDQVHFLIENPFIKSGGRMELSYPFLKTFEQSQNFEVNPLYVLLHEAIYCEGTASNWSANRVRSEFPEFDAGTTSDVKYFTGEMVYPWMLDQYDYLHPMKDAANLIAEYDRWPDLYDLDKLKNNDVRVNALVYHDDMYVEREYSENVAETTGNTKLWITNEYDHNGLRMDGYRIMERLLGMLKGDIEI